MSDSLPSLTDSARGLAKMSPKQKLVFGLGIVVVGAIVLLPLVIFLLKFVASLIALAIAGLILAGLTAAVPMLTRWWRNRVLIMMKNEARRNPIETLEAEYLDRRSAYTAAQQVTTEIIAHHSRLAEKRDEFVANHERGDPKIDAMIDTFSRLVVRLREELAASGQALEAYRGFIAFQRDRWELAKSTGELADLLKTAGGGDVTSAFLADTAVDAVRTSFHRSFAEIEVILQGEVVTALPLQVKMPKLVLSPEPALIARG